MSVVDRHLATTVGRRQVKSNHGSN